MNAARFCESTPDGRVIHCGPAQGNDYVLCGAAMDGETGGEFMIDVSRGKINCHRCVAIIRFCKAIPARILASSGKGD